MTSSSRSNELETNLERRFREELEKRGLKRGIDFSTQFPIRNSFILDFAFPLQKVYVETDGEIWHSSPEAKKRDWFKDHIMKRKGWTVFRFTGSQIDESVESCVNTVIDYINRKGN